MSTVCRPLRRRRSSSPAVCRVRAGSAAGLRQSTYRVSGRLGRKSKRGPDGARGLDLQTKNGEPQMSQIFDRRRMTLAAVLGALLASTVAGHAAEDTIKVVRVAFAVGHHGHFRNDPEGHGPLFSSTSRTRRAACSARSLRRWVGRSGLQLAAVRRKGARADLAGQGLGGVRLLDVGQPQVGAAGVQGAQLDPVLSRPVTRARNRNATSSTPVPPPTSKPSQPSTT